MTALQALGYRPSVPVTANQFADAALRETWIREKGMVVLQLISDQHRETTIDLFVSEPFDFDREYERALLGEVFPGLEMRFVSLNSLIAMKECAGREKDLEDIRQLRLIREDNSNG
jgi:cyclopropane fatty-acyl-phospholipid synthase-like methyltransferase